MRRFLFAIMLCALAPTIALAQEDTPQAKQCTACEKSAEACQQCATATEEPACCAASKKVVMYSFTADWCGPCKAMKKEVFADEAVAACLSKNCQVVTVDIDEDQAMAKKFEVNAIPTQIFVSADGKIIKKLVGSTNKEALIAAVKESAAHAQENAAVTKQATITLTSPKITVKKNASAKHVVTTATGDNIVTFTVNGKTVKLQAHSIKIEDKNGEIRLEARGTKLSNPVRTGVLIEKLEGASSCQPPAAEVQATKALPPLGVFLKAPQHNVEVHEIQRVVNPDAIHDIFVKRIRKSADGEEIEVEVTAGDACPQASCANCASATKCEKCSQCPHDKTTAVANLALPAECPASSCPASSCPASSCPASSCPTATSPAGAIAAHCFAGGQCPISSAASTCPTSTCPTSTCPTSTCPTSTCPASTCQEGSCPAASCPAVPLQAPTAMGVWNAFGNLHAAHAGVIAEQPYVIRPSEETPQSGSYCVVTTTGQRHSYAGEFVRMTDDFIMVKENGTTHWIPRDNVECLSVTEEKIATRPQHPLSATRATVFPHPIALPYPGATATPWSAPHASFPKMAQPAVPAETPRTQPAKNVYHIDMTLKHGDEVITHPQLMTLGDQRACVEVGRADGLKFYAGVEVHEIPGVDDIVMVTFFDQADGRGACTQMVCQDGDSNSIPWTINDQSYELVVKVDEHDGNQSCCQQGQATAKEVPVYSAEGIRTNFETQLPKIKK